MRGLEESLAFYFWIIYICLLMCCKVLISIGVKYYYASKLVFQYMLPISGQVKGCNKSVLCDTESTHAITESTVSALSFPLHALFA